MKQNHSKFCLPIAGWVFIAIFLVSVGCRKTPDIKSSQNIDEIASANTNLKSTKLLKDFEMVNLVGSNNEYNPVRIDPNLVNAWGIAFSPGGTPWINALGTGLSLVYDKEGNQVRTPVAIPSPATATGGHPTGIVFNPTPDFKLSNGIKASFIFVAVDGVISGWNSAAGNFALRVVNNSATSVYTGATLAADGSATFLYAANFRAGRIDVFDKNFAMVSKPFTDPDLPAGYSPFNIQVVDGKLYVMYAKVGPDGEEDKHPGFGYVDIYNTNGSLWKRFVSRHQLNAPWGVAHAPAGFFEADENDPDVKKGDKHKFTDAILIGNFGDGRINAYTPDGDYLGQLRMHGKPIEIEGLWAITFPPVTATAIDQGRLYFAAGPDDEKAGLFGYILKKE